MTMTKYTDLKMTSDLNTYTRLLFLMTRMVGKVCILGVTMRSAFTMAPQPPSSLS